MAVGPEFPAFVKIQYQRDGAVESAFLASMDRLTSGAEQRFNSSFAEIGAVVERTLSGFKRGNFKLDLDMSSLRQATADADHTYQKLVTLRDAAQKLAIATNDTSDQTKSYVQALREQTIEAEGARSAAFEQFQTYGRLQGAVDKLIDRNHALAISYRETFLEQAKSENRAFFSQKSVNAVAAPGLNARAADKAPPIASCEERAKAKGLGITGLCDINPRKLSFYPINFRPSPSLREPWRMEMDQ